MPSHHRPSSVAALFRAAAPIAIALAGSIWLVGCDTPANQTDRKVQADVAKAQAALANGDTRTQADAQHALEQAAADTSTPPLTRAYAKSSLAQVEQGKASEVMKQIDLNSMKMHALVYEISQLTDQVESARVVAAGYDKYDPKPARDALAASIADAQGGPDKLVWFKQDANSIPSLAAVKQSISQLQDQIAKQQDQLKALQDQRTQTLDEAEQADKSSEIAKGQQSVDEFKRAADLRKQAGDLQVQIDKNQAQTVPLQKDLAVAQGQQTILEELIKQYQDQSEAIDAGWKATQDAVASQATLEKQIVAGGGDVPAPSVDASKGGILSPTTAGSINDKADALGKLVQELTAQRSTAMLNLNNAISHYRDAATAAQEFYTTESTKIGDPANTQRPEQDAWKNMLDITNPAVYRMQEALAERQLAALYVSQVVGDNARLAVQEQVSKILGSVNIAVPQALSDAQLDEDKKTAASAAVEAYDKAEKSIRNIKDGASPAPIKNLARLEYVLTLYGQVQLARATGDTSAAQEKLNDTLAARSEVAGDSTQLPPLPPEIAAPPAATGSTPAVPGT